MQKNLMTKIAIIAFISVLFFIPFEMIMGKIYERASYLSQAQQSVGNSWTGRQTVMTALLVIPYEVTSEIILEGSAYKERTTRLHTERYYKYIIPETMSVQAKIDNTIRQKGIYNIPVYTSEITIKGAISRQQIAQAIKEIEQVEVGKRVDQAYLTTTVLDPRGINSIPTLQWDNESIAFQPGSKFVKNNNGLHAVIEKLSDFNNELINFDFTLALRGMKTLSFIPIGKQSSVNALSSWPHPEFIGAFLPVKRSINDQGYQASWAITSFASNIVEKVKQCENGNCEGLFKSEFGIRHIEAVDVYLQSERSVKYGMLFIGLIFISFFIFEIIMKLPIHPIQYTLVGFAIAIFYLLLISLSEQISFLASYVIAATCCIALLLGYLRVVLAGFKHALFFSGILTILYGSLYIIVSAEDLALVMGALLTFISLAIVMYSTRNIDWYQVSQSTVHKDKDQAVL